MNTIKRHHEQIQLALDFLKKVRFTTALHLQMVAGRNRRGFPTQLLKLGLVVCRKMVGGQVIYALSVKGAGMVGARPFDVHKVTLSRLEHAFVAQFETLDSIEYLDIIGYEFEPQKFNRDVRPDVIWETRNGHKYSVEVEISAKTPAGGDLDRFFLKIIKHPTIIVFTDSVLQKRYLMHALEYAQRGIPDWKCLEGKWIKFDDFIMVDRAVWDRVYFKPHQCGMTSLTDYFEETLGIKI